MGVKKSTVSTAANESEIFHTAASSFVSYPSNNLLSTGKEPALLKEESMSLRSPGLHLAAQPPFEVSCVRRMRSISEAPTGSHELDPEQASTFGLEPHSNKGIPILLSSEGEYIS